MTTATAPASVQAARQWCERYPHHYSIRSRGVHECSACGRQIGKADPCWRSESGAMAASYLCQPCHSASGVGYKLFRVAAVSANTNSFGLTGHVLVARDGEAWEVARSTRWVKGEYVRVPLIFQTYQWARLSVEIPRRLTPDAPPAVVAEVFA